MTCNLRHPMSLRHPVRVYDAMTKDLFVCRTWLICVQDMTHLCAGRDSFVRGTWLIPMNESNDSEASATKHSDMTHSQMCHDSFICRTWLVPIWQRDISYETQWRELSTNVPWLVYMRDVTHFYMSHGSATKHTVTWPFRKCAMTQVYAGCDSLHRSFYTDNET